LQLPHNGETYDVALLHPVTIDGPFPVVLLDLGKLKPNYHVDKSGVRASMMHVVHLTTS
jgi:hypothetical protein